MIAAVVKLGSLLLLMTLGTSQCRRSEPRMESPTACFLAEYAKRRGWEEVVLFLKSPSGVADLVMALSRRGVSVGLQNIRNPQFPVSVAISRHGLGAVVLLGSYISPSEEEFLEQVSQKQLYQTYISWLFITNKHTGVVDVKSTIEERLRFYNIALDTDLVVATMTRKRPSRGYTNKNNRSKVPKNETDEASHQDTIYHTKNRRKKEAHDHSFLRVYKQINETRNSTESRRTKDQHSAHMSGSSGIFWLHILSDKTVNTSNNGQEEKMRHQIGTCMDYANHSRYAGIQFNLTQVYKIRPGSNMSLVTVDLGYWEANNTSDNMVQPSSIEQRNNLNGYPLLVGIRNASQNAVLGTTVGTGSDGTAGAVVSAALTGASSATPNILDDDAADDTSLMDLLEYIAKFLNASYELVPFSKLGWQNDEGAWLYLLGAVTQGTVDIGLDNVVITQERYRDMFFTLPVVEAMKNIYFRRPDSSALRDIFLAPFSPRLLASVALTGVILSLAMLLVNAFTAKKITVKEHKPKSVLRNCLNEHDTKHWNFGEAVVWSVSILCMQGSPWSPKSPSGSFILIFSLFFALVIYNAYAAFITSVLSVRVASIRGLEDLLDSDFQFGYTLGGQDEAFLRTVNDTALRRLYFRGLVRNHGVEEASEGLIKASHGGYAFFVSARLARKALNSFIAQDRRCDVQELYVEATKSSIALPMGIVSPYRKLINLSLLQMREEGILGYIQRKMLPSMPHCQAYSTFNSASLTDVYSAFLLLGGGLTIGFGLGLLENFWQRKSNLCNWMTERLCKKESLLYKLPSVRKHSQLTPDISWIN